MSAPVDQSFPPLPDTVTAALACVVMYAVARAFASAGLVPGISGKQDQHDFAQNLVSFVHGALGFALAVKTLAPIAPADMLSENWLVPYKGEVVFWNRLMLSVSIGYMVVDLFLTVLLPVSRSKWLDTALMVLHHVLVLYTFIWTLVNDDLAAYGPALHELCEVTNPLYHTRWYLKKIDSRGAFSVFIDLSFFVTFISTRFFLPIFILMGPYRRFYATMRRWDEKFMVIFGIAFIILNFYWCYLAVTKAYKVFILGEKEDAKKPRTKNE
jgi:hypothetical protein